MRAALAAILVLAALRAQAGAVHASDQSAEERLRAWLHSQPLPRPRPTESLHDAVAAAPLSSLRLMKRLPGLSEEPFDVCRTLERCPRAPLSFHVEQRELVDDAVTALLRPWIALSKATSLPFLFSPAEGTSRFVTASVPGLMSRPLHVDAAAAPTGGYDVWLEDSRDVAASYDRALGALNAGKSN